MIRTMMVLGMLLPTALFICAPAPAADLRALSMDDPFAIGLKIASDSEIRVEGKAALRITTQWPTTVCLGEVTELDIADAKLIYRARVRSELDGIAFLEMWAHLGAGRYFSRGLNDTIQGSSDWKSIQTPFLFEKGQRPDKITLNVVINGVGTVWIDDVVLSEEPIK